MFKLHADYSLCLKSNKYNISFYSCDYSTLSDISDMLKRTNADEPTTQMAIGQAISATNINIITKSHISIK